jgi:hypothetical protein
LKMEDYDGHNCKRAQRVQSVKTRYFFGTQGANSGRNMPRRVAAKSRWKYWCIWRDNCKEERSITTMASA